MTIAYLGNFIPAFSTENDFKWTLEKLGHIVIPMQESVVSAEQVRETMKTCDMLFYSHTHGWNTPGIKEVLQELKAEGKPSIAYHLDTWMGLDRERDIGTDDYWSVEHFFTVDKHMADYMNTREDLPKGYYLPAGVLERDCFFGNIQDKYKYDVVFVGSYAYHPEWPHRQNLINHLQKYNFRRFGEPNIDQPDAYVVRQAELNDLFASAKIVIGDSLSLKDNYWSDRVYLTTGAGGFIIHPYIKGLDTQFKKDEMTYYNFNDFTGLDKKIDYYIKHEAERLKRRDAGFKRTYHDHTYTKRFQELFKNL